MTMQKMHLNQGCVGLNSPRNFLIFCSEADEKDGGDAHAGWLRHVKLNVYFCYV
jgi:hypothetical protein